MRFALLLVSSLALAGEPPTVADSPAWHVTARAVGHATIGKPALVELVVEARGDFHLNDEYPINVRTQATNEASFDKAHFDRSDGIVVTPCADRSHGCIARVPVRFVPRQAGALHVGGTIAFSACDDERCLIEKVAVAALVDVAAR